MDKRELIRKDVAYSDWKLFTRHLRMMTRPVLLLLLAVLSVSACGTLTQELEQEDAESATVTINIKARLVESEDIDAAAVLVELEDGVVVLSGFVASEDEESEVVRIAKGEAKEYSVQNELIIK